MASTPPLTADVACCATSLATRVTRAIGAGTRDFLAFGVGLFFADLFAAPTDPARFGARRGFVALRAELERLDAAAPPRRDFTAGRLAALRLPVFPPVLARDFFAFEAIGLLHRESVVNGEGAAADTARTGLSGGASFRPLTFL